MFYSYCYKQVDDRAIYILFCMYGFCVGLLAESFLNGVYPDA